MRGPCALLLVILGLAAGAPLRADSPTAREVVRDWRERRLDPPDASVEAGQVEDFAVDNGERPIREVAIEVLLRNDWISRAQAASI